tara:strand:- start:1125 stop:1994 length:870 start_codon:yes stop_codon:yes gene_type:complete
MPYNSKTINVDVTYKCTLKCAGCIRQDEDYTIIKNEISLGEFEKLVDYYDELLLCGGQSDPIFHSQLNEMLKMCKDKGKTVQVHTAANHKKKSVYDQAFKSNLNAKWFFGIDGLPEQSHMYRKGQDGQFLFERMLDAKRLGLYVEWQYIVFDYNEEYQLDAYKLAKEHGLVLQILEGSTDESGENTKLIYNYETEIKPRCLTNRTPQYYSATGNILPCCWLNKQNKGLEELFDNKLNLKDNTIKDIHDSTIWKMIEQRIKTDPPKICRKRCGINQDQEDAKTKRYRLNV